MTDLKPTITLVSASNIQRVFKGRGGTADVRALCDLNITVTKGETLGLVGESGSGKSTLGRILVGLDKPTSGDVKFEGVAITTEDGPAFRAQRKLIQFVFQDPMAALNPRLTVEKQVAEAIRAHEKMSWYDALEIARGFLEAVGISRQMASRYVHQLSGGQRQRAVIARALVLRPEFVVFDEPVSALDLSIQAQILELIKKMKETLNVTAVFISHDLRVVRYISDRIAVLYLGRIVELGDADQIFHNPRHPYTQSLLSAIPHIDPSLQRKSLGVVGELKQSDSSLSGCAFAPRCPFKLDRCTQEMPQLRQLSVGGSSACHLSGELE